MAGTVNKRGFLPVAPRFSGDVPATPRAIREAERRINKREAKNTLKVLTCRAAGCRLKVASLVLYDGKELAVNIRGPVTRTDDYTFEYTAPASANASGMNFPVGELEPGRTINVRCAKSHWFSIDVKGLQDIATSAMLVAEPQNRGPREAS